MRVERWVSESGVKMMALGKVGAKMMGKYENKKTIK